MSSARIRPINRGRCFAPATAPLAVLLRECHSYNRLHDITGILRYTSEGRFLQVLEGPKSAVRRLYYHGILSDPRHYHCQMLGEGMWPLHSFATWTMGFNYAQSPTTCALCSARRPLIASASNSDFNPAPSCWEYFSILYRRTTPAWQEHP